MKWAGGPIRAIWLIALLAWPLFGHDARAHSPGKPKAEPISVGVAPVGDIEFTLPEPGSYALPPIRAAANGRVLDAQGRRRALSEVMAGRITLLSFVYTRCADANGCPLATGILLDIMRISASEPDLARDLRLVTLSFDPGHDTPAVMAEYGKIAAAAPDPKAEWEFLTAESEATLKPLLAGFGQVRIRQPSETYAHLLRLFLIDRQGLVRNIYGVGILDPRLLIADIRTLLIEEAAGLRN